jgi:hypothetical protein
MRHRVSIQRPEGPVEERAIDRLSTAGGSHADDIHLPDAPAASLRLEPRPAGLVVTAETAGVRAGGRPVAPGARRLVRGGEAVELHGTVLTLLAPTRPELTRAAAAGLLAEAAAGEAPLAGAHLVVLTGAAAGHRFPLGPDETVGRGRGASIRLPDAEASRRHARIRLCAGGATIEDLGSRNGLRVNGVRVDRRPSPLRAGDEIAVGETALAFEDPFGPAAAPSEAGRGAPGAAPRARGRAGLPRSHAAAAALLVLAATLLLAAS